ncbi:M14 family metallopeptidase [Pseudoflavitalea rhizosphaerae]|uniref:M14 family metallopeptidase n=1 Tax=Pseudoflavitalea rhizosphaerae TaxID=1884793 RepID=UPI000F8E1445|nr:M14 family metallopeptidase [Pseudoflavitalea rhizosphaerae]
MRKSTLLLITCFISHLVMSQPITTTFEQTNGKETPTYPQIIAWWKQLDQKFAEVQMLTMGPTDAGFPLHLVILSKDKDTNLASLRKKNKRIILINNGIHPGEPDGIDASMLLARDILTNKASLPSNVVLAIIPVYNIGGCLNRSEYYRVDQNGPDAFGSRGNSQNLDLNRDFIKCDSKEARSFAEIFHNCDPDVFVDNHVSNGADYQHIMTLLSSQHNKLGGAMGEFLHNTFEPALYKEMKEKDFEMVPYVDFAGKTPEEGLNAYFDGPRYSSGYATLWHSFAFVPETHMLKNYLQRVAATYVLMQCFINFTSQYSEQIKTLRDQTKKATAIQSSFPIAWQADKQVSIPVTYKGYGSGMKSSEVSGLPRLYYDRTKPWTKEIPYFHQYNVKTTVEKPKAYIIPQGWWKVIGLLKLNRIKMRRLTNDSTINVEAYRIESYTASSRPYELHHNNSEVKISSRNLTKTFRKGDYYIPLDQAGNRFLVEVLEPQAPDSYFAWNFFDGILSQKEGFSSYAFEDKAADYLKEHPELRTRLNEKKAADTAFGKSAFAQLDFIFKNSPWYEPGHMQYPVYRVVN